MRKILHLIGILGFLSCFLGSDAVLAEYGMNLPMGVTLMSHKIYHLHMLMFYICLVIGLGVFIALFYALYRFRKKEGVKAQLFHGSVWVELIWTAIPLVLVIIMLVPAVRVLYELNDVRASTKNIKITGIQWKSRYDYLEDGLSFYSSLSTPMDQIKGKEPKGKHYLLEVDKPLVLPVRQKIKLLFTSNDVNHSWWVPELGIKRDCIPGYVGEAWIYIEKPGVYRGQCTELCGMQHGFMPIVVEAKTEKDYQEWLKLQKGGQLEEVKTMSKNDLLAKGKEVYAMNCQACHQENGQGLPPAIRALAGSKKVTGDEACPISILLNGIQGSAMQSFAEQLNDVEIAAVLSYVRNSWGNDDKAKHGDKAGSLIQPEEVKSARSDWKANATKHECVKKEST